MYSLKKGDIMSNMKKKSWIYAVTFVVFVCISMFCLAATKYGWSSAASTGKVTATSLNVRSKASTSGNILAKISKGTTVTILGDTKDSSGTKWYKISVSVNSKKVTGYVSAEYISVTTSSSSSNSSSSSSSFLKRFGYVNASSLNLRSSTSTNSFIVAKLKNSQYVLVIGKKVVSGTTWYRVSATVNDKTVRGYVVAQYIKIYSTTVEKTKYDLAVVKSKTLPMYKTANTYDTKRATLKKSQNVIIRGTLTVRGVKWALVTANVNKKGMNGYVKLDCLTSVTATASDATKTPAVMKTKASCKKIAASMSTNVATVPKGQELIVKATLTVLNKQWYKCSFTLSGTSYTGYILASNVEIPSDAEFQEELAAFPSSYKASIKELHEKYPDWHFVAIDTGLNWDTVIANESKFGKNTIQSNQPKGGAVSTYSAPFSYLSTDSGAYNWATDKYTLCDGSNWYTANADVIAYYMDPRNSLTEDTIWQFESLAYDKRQKEEVVESILSNTFMKNSYSVTDKITGNKVTGTYVDAFMDAGKINNVSPYFLSIRSKQELGTSGSGASSGTYSGYEGYYNFFNIGAYDSSTGQAIANGLKYASSGSTYNRPWTTPYKAIVGGAQYIASSYIAKGQNTVHFQKFNVVYSPLYSHQYMTNVQAPTSEAKSTFKSYTNMGIAKDSFVFYIPVYNNMPSSSCKLPASQGNPNSYVKSITVKNGSKSLALTPTFNYTDTNYTMVVDNSISSVIVDATPVSAYATISGKGTYNLTAGKTTTVSLVCTAGNGTKTTYKVKISRKAS